MEGSKDGLEWGWMGWARRAQEQQHREAQLLLSGSDNRAVSTVPAVSSRASPIDRLNVPIKGPRRAGSCLVPLALSLSLSPLHLLSCHITQ